MGMFIVLTVVVVLQVYNVSKLIKWHTLNMCDSLHVNYTSLLKMSVHKEVILQGGWRAWPEPVGGQSG